METSEDLVDRACNSCVRCVGDGGTSSASCETCGARSAASDNPVLRFFVKLEDMITHVVARRLVTVEPMTVFDGYCIHNRCWRSEEGFYREIIELRLGANKKLFHGGGAFPMALNIRGPVITPIFRSCLNAWSAEEDVLSAVLENVHGGRT